MGPAWHNPVFAFLVKQWNSATVCLLGNISVLFSSLQARSSIVFQILSSWFLLTCTILWWNSVFASTLYCLDRFFDLVLRLPLPIILFVCCPPFIVTVRFNWWDSNITSIIWLRFFQNFYISQISSNTVLLRSWKFIPTFFSSVVEASHRPF